MKEALWKRLHTVWLHLCDMLQKDNTVASVKTIGYQELGKGMMNGRSMENF
jgi:hypothetical protein